MNKLFKLFAAASVFAFIACSSDSSSDNPANAENPTSEYHAAINPSQCDLATQKLPASSLVWQPSFTGCEVAQAFELTELQAFDQQLLEGGFNKRAITTESFIYNHIDYDFASKTVIGDTLTFAYAMGFFSGNFTSGSRAMSDKEIQTFALQEVCPTLPEDFVAMCSNFAKSGIDKEFRISTKMNHFSDFEQAFAARGWSCTSKPGMYAAMRYYTCNTVFEGKSYTFTSMMDDQGEGVTVFRFVIKYNG